MKRRGEVWAGPSWDDIREEKRRDPELARLYHATRPRARLACFLREQRQQAGFSSDELATTLGWSESRVLELESVTGPWPDAEALRAYLTVCVNGG